MVDHTGQVTGTKAIVDVHNAYAAGTGIEHGQKRRHAASPSERAQAVMRRMLMENKTMQSSDVLAACEKQGISRATVYRARKGLPIQEERSGREKYWSLSDASQISQTPVQGKAET